MFKQLVEFVVKNLVDKPESVNLTEEVIDSTVVIKLRVDASDLGKVIGKSGKTARSIRTLLFAVASKEGKRISFEILK